MKKMFFVFVASLVAFVFVGCGTKYTPIANVKFDKVHVELENQVKMYANQYQSQEEMEKKYNVCIQDWLKQNNLINPNSEYTLNVYIWHYRGFVWLSNRLSNPAGSTSVSVLKNGIIERKKATGKLHYEPGFFTNLKTVFGQSKAAFEDRTIEAFCNHATGVISKVLGK